MIYLFLAIFHVFCMFLPYPKEWLFFGIGWNSAFAIWDFYVYNKLKQREED